MELSPRERLIAIGVAVCVGAYAVDAAVVGPLRKRLDEATTDVERDRAADKKGQDLLNNQMRAQQLWNRMAGSTLKTDMPSAESQLLAKVRDAAQGAGLTLESFKPGGSDRERDYQRIVYRAAGVGNMSQVRRFLETLRTADIPLKVTDVQIESRKDGTDDLSLSAGIATIYALPPEPAKGSAR
jgi:Tfp pilus assembly protein PilO